jgi:lysozyme
MDNRIIDSIKKHEGYEPRVYKCSEGYDTIGYGFAVKDLVLSENVADLILAQKLSELAIRLTQKFDWIKTANEDVLLVVVNMCYQLGVNGFSKFKKTIYYLETEQYEEASEEMLDSLWAKQTPNRAKELSEILKNTKEKSDECIT